MGQEEIVGILDFNIGSIRSLQRKILKFGFNSVVLSKPSDFDNVTKLVLPGVGNFAKGMENINKSILKPVLEDLILRKQIPILGICLGMQMFSDFGEEGSVEGLGWISGKTVKFDPQKMDCPQRIPHVGWNTSIPVKPCILYENVENKQGFYFTHSYHFKCQDSKNEIAQTKYGYTFTSCIQKENIFGVQFHPEKSHLDGIKILVNFLKIPRK